jgi:DeoR/GlpR family transcriptional regulator of sugar metabolism
MIADGETVVLDSGTTCLEVARLLHARPVTVMPLSLQAVQVLSEAGGAAELVVPGGRPRAAEGALTGPLTLASLAALRFDTAVIGCCGLSAADGLTAYDLDDAAVKKASIASARRAVVATDGGKLGRTAFAHVGPSALLHTLVTDAAAPAAEVAAIEAAGTAVRTV